VSWYDVGRDLFARTPVAFLNGRRRQSQSRLTDGLSGGGCAVPTAGAVSGGGRSTVGVKYIIIRRTIIIIIMIRVRIFMTAAVEVHEFALRGFLLYILLYYNIVISYNARRLPVTTTYYYILYVHRACVVCILYYIYMYMWYTSC